MTRRIAFINEKGGTGKTTLAVHTAAWLATEAGARVLLVDLDTQGHAGKSLGVDVRALTRTVADLLLEPQASPEGVRVSTGVPRLDLLPANRDCADLPERLAPFDDRRLRLRQVIDAIAGDYDYVVFDAPPSLGLVTVNVLLATREVVVPVAVTYLSLDGCAEVVRTVTEVSQAHRHHALEVTRVVPTLYRRTRLADEVLGRLAAYFPGRLSPALGFNVKIDEAQSHGQTVWEYAPWSRGAQMLEAVARDVMDAADPAPALAAVGRRARS